MRVVVFGATGNVGTSVLEALGADPEVNEIVAVARRAPSRTFPKTTFRAADIVHDELSSIVRAADAVVHLAWLIQPSRDRDLMHRVNVEGSRRVFQACADGGARAIIYASSVGAYSKGPKDRAVDESWPTNGIPTSFYSVNKAEVERELDRFETEHPGIRVVRLRPGLIFKAEAASEIRHLFAGKLLPPALVRPDLLPFVPEIEGLRFQVVHSHDVGQGFRLATVNTSARGAYNLAADPVIGTDELAQLLHVTRRVRLSPKLLRILADLSYRLHVQPTEPGWLDMGLSVPIMDTARARQELGWEPAHASVETLAELLAAMRGGVDYQTPPLSRAG